MDVRGAIARLPQRLGVRIAALLTIALLPLGLIAMVQTRQVAEVAQERAELTLLALTERAVTADRVLTQRALGSARALAAVMPAIQGDEAECIRRMRELVATTDAYSFAGFIPVDGVMRCSSTGTPFDFRGWPDRDESLTDVRPRVSVNVDAPLSGTSVIIVSHPAFDEDNELLGYVSLSVPTALVRPEVRPANGLMDLTVFTRDGVIVTASRDGPGAVERSLPAGTELASLVASEPRVFTSPDRGGEARTFAVIPFAENQLFAIGSFDNAATEALSGALGLPAWTFPLLMWGVGLLVAYAAIHRLVIRHVNALGQRMKRFAAARVLPDETASPEAPLEIAAMEDTFAEMAHQILRDEAEAENALHRQQVLLKEVHHRVKNNLQLISSIVNMQMRELNAPEARFALQRVQDRVLGLAAIHRNLYQNTSLEQISVDGVVREIAEQMVAIAASGPDDIVLTTELEDVALYPDQAVPLCMFLAETLTNALKYLGQPADGRPWVEVRLDRPAPGQVRLTTENSLAPANVAPIREPGGSSGLGTRLLGAFAAQLDGDLSTGTDGGVYRASVSFAVKGFADADAGAARKAAAGVAAE